MAANTDARFFIGFRTLYSETVCESVRVRDLFLIAEIMRHKA